MAAQHIETEKAKHEGKGGTCCRHVGFRLDTENPHGGPRRTEFSWAPLTGACARIAHWRAPGGGSGQVRPRPACRASRQGEHPTFLRVSSRSCLCPCYYPGPKHPGWIPG